MLGRAWRSWRAKSRLIAPMHTINPSRFLAAGLMHPGLDDSPGRPEFPPYHFLADLWHEHSRRNVPNYPAFLQHLAAERKIPLDSVLELACGAGTITERLAAIVPTVVGLDVNELMLKQARQRCADQPGVSIVPGDFRTFDLRRHFDAVVCACDSLNYVRGAEELEKVFRRVAAHLAPGGVFVFDTQTEGGMQLLSGQYLHAQAGERRYALRFRYDAEQRVESSAVVFKEGIEVHRRVPIDPADVIEAAHGSGLRVDDYFSSAVWPGRWRTGLVCFYVLTREDP